jgi:hypothetical protein
MKFKTRFALRILSVMLIAVLSFCELSSAAGEQAIGENEKDKIVKVEVYIPVDKDHSSLINYLKSLGAKYERKVSVEIIDIGKKNGYQRWRKINSACCGILINGETRFKTQINGQDRTVEFLGPVNVFWSKYELEKVLEQKLLKNSFSS